MSWIRKPTRREGKIRKEAPRADVCWISWKLDADKYSVRLGSHGP